MENILQAVKDAAIRLLKDYEPEVSVYAEEILRTDGTLETGEEDGAGEKWYFVEVIPTSFTTVSPFQTEVSLTVAVDYHEQGESIREYGEKAIALDHVLRPVFRFFFGGEWRRITVSRVNVNISGGLLHMTFPLVFLVSEEEKAYPMMESLESREE